MSKINSLVLTQCEYFAICNGCNQWNISSADEQKNKLKYLKNLMKETLPQTNDSRNIMFPEMGWTSNFEFGQRHRFDFTLDFTTQQISPAPLMGLYNSQRELIEITKCLQLSPELQNVFYEFRTLTQKHLTTRLQNKGSIRLRVGPSGLKGCWFDLSNIDIKFLLNDFEYFNQLIEADFKIEIGQKGKSLQKISTTNNSSLFKLKDPVPQIWFQAYDKDNQPYNLQGLISDFTQPSWKSAQTLTEKINHWISQIKKTSSSHNQPQKAIEFGSGLGQFTIPLLSWGYQVNAYEYSAQATQLLQKNVDHFSATAPISIFTGDYQKQPTHLDEKIDIALVNPPRSGLKLFANELVKINAENCFYISCFPESMVEDLKVLAEGGYNLIDIQIVNQFPKTTHFETCVWLQRST